MKRLRNYISCRWQSFKEERISPILVLLVTVSTACMLIANIIAAKTFTLFSVADFDVLLPCAVVVFPITYVCSDIFSEVYGYRWSRRTAWISFALNLLMVAFFEIAIVMPGVTDLSVLHSTWFLLLASLVAYMVGDFVNDVVFQKMKLRQGQKKFVVRAVLSSVIGEFCDSAVYIPLGMGVLPLLVTGSAFMTWPQIGMCVLIQPLIKFCFELVVSPLTSLLAKKLKRIENIIQ